MGYPPPGAANLLRHSFRIISISPFNYITMKPSFLAILLPMLAMLACRRDNDPPQDPVALTDRVLADNLRLPWEILWGPDNHIWMTERGGHISRVNPATGAVSPLLTINDVVEQGEGGLLGMALHPDFNANPQVFISYNYDNGGYKEKIVRYNYSNGSLTNAVTILENIAGARNHNGCRLVFGPDKKLYISTGDAENQSSAQSTSSLNGKILRIETDGSIPSDNPIAGSAIWSLGHRNAQGLVWHNNILYSSEHGPSNDDEINIIQKGRNYGWPNVHGLCNTSAEQTFCAANNVVEPLQVWTPTIATCGLEFYDKDRIPQWKNSLLLCTLKGSTLYQLELNNTGTSITNTVSFLANKYGRLRDVCISPEGKVYVCTSNANNDKIIEIDKAESE